MSKPIMAFDLEGFTKRASRVGAERATIELVTNLLQLTHKAMTQTPRPAPKRGPQK